MCRLVVMKLLDLTLDTPAANLALDEALLETADESDADYEVLRIWESPQPAVVIGRASRVADEVDVSGCQDRGIPILRRCSGGAAVVIGPGCLMYSMVLSTRRQPELQQITAAHRYALGVVSAALQPLAPGVRAQGTSDLTCGDRKFSGNSMRVRRSHILYHGTVLYDFPMDLVPACLRTPPRQPEYRMGRAHADFVRNLPVSRTAVTAALVAAWHAHENLVSWPRDKTRMLVQTRYSQASWNLRF